MTIVAYYSDWREREWTCPCGWSGTGDDAAHEPFEALLQVDCPSCDKRVLIVNYPDERETRAAAKRGNPEAIRAVESLKQVEEKRSRWLEERLVNPAELPALDGVDRIDLALQVDEQAEGGAQMILLVNGEEVHHEGAWFEDAEPLSRFLVCARERYGDRIASIDITFGARLYLSGDSLRLSREIDRALAEHGFDHDGQPLKRNDAQ